MIVTQINHNQRQAAYTRSVHWLSEVHLAGFAPTLALLIFNSLCQSTTANAPSNRRYALYLTLGASVEKNNTNSQFTE